ncbi:flagellar biosynthetic protein FliO [Enterobacterales bacterium CwR94]|nr:flagellar biosynthetic protein FliO [Enterobacterales bacterium CwR94]
MKPQPHLTTSTGADSAPLSTGGMLAQVSSVLAGIILLILFAGWLVKRLGFSPRKHGQHGLSVSASCSLGGRERVVVVDIEGARLILGVTAQHVTHLHTLPAAQPDEQPPTATPPTDFRQLIQSLTRGRS